MLSPVGSGLWVYLQTGQLERGVGDGERDKEGGGKGYFISYVESFHFVRQLV